MRGGEEGPAESEEEELSTCPSGKLAKESSDGRGGASAGRFTGLADGLTLGGTSAVGGFVTSYLHTGH